MKTQLDKAANNGNGKGRNGRKAAVIQAASPVAYVHFDPPVGAQNNLVEALVHRDDLDRVHRGLYVSIASGDGRLYVGRIVEGPYYDPDALSRDSTPTRFIILNQGQGQGKATVGRGEGRTLALPEYHARAQVEILGEQLDGELQGANRRPRPASPVHPFDSAQMEDILHLRGNIRLGLLDGYGDVYVQLDGDDKGVLPRNLLTVGTIGSGKSNTCQVVVEETLAAGYAQIVVDPEGEYVFMDQATRARGAAEALAPYGRVPAGVPSITVYRPPLATSMRPGAVPFSVPFDSLPADLVSELIEMTPAQETRFTFLYDQAVRLLRKERELAGERVESVLTRNGDLDLSRGYPGITLDLLLSMLDQELDYYAWKQENKPGGKAAAAGSRKRPTTGAESGGGEAADDPEPGPEPMKIYCHQLALPPLVADQYDVASYGALRKKLRELRLYGIFDRADAPPLDMEALTKPGHLSVLDMSDAPGQQVVNIIIADLLSRMYHYKLGLTEAQNSRRKVVITIEEAHGFVSRERQDRMAQTLDQLRRIARRGRKRWLVLHFVTQSPQHLPPELYELANNKVIHQVTGAENLRVLKAAAGGVAEGVWDDVPALGRGRAVIVSSQYPHPLVARIRPAASRRNYSA
jgi:hypothetical protein